MKKMEKMEKMEEFKKNMEAFNLSNDFIKKALQYFAELEEEKELQEMATVEEVIDYYNRCGSFTYNTIQSELNLKDFRGDILKLYDCDTNNILDFSKYFENIEEFEIQILYCLYYEFYPVTPVTLGKKNKKEYNGLLRVKII